MSDREFIYKVKDLALSFGGIVALRKVNIELEKGKIYGIIGPNGAGKSSFFNCLSGEYAPTSGSIVYMNESLPRYKYMFAKHGICRTYQNIRLFNTSVLDNIKLGFFTNYRRNLFEAMLGLGKQKENELDKKAFDVLKEVGLDENIAYTQALQLPYGKQRLVEIARSLIGSPKVLLLDEPVAGMNTHEMQQIISLIKKIFHKDITIIIVEHHLDFLFQLCEKIFLFVNGELIMGGDRNMLLANKIFQREYLGN